jgi:hypothetical protein
VTSSFVCPVCGYPNLRREPYTNAGGGSYEICWSCGFEFGVSDDADGFTHESWRARWVSMGMPWDSAELRSPPEGWDPQAQLAALLDGS